ncbi:MAG: helicase-exonuclease AddAB subunit AddA [Clostridia bacterium]|nr:helicase-exonuclease AddAB subunit AddA [Clostridia bacterium]
MSDIRWTDDQLKAIDTRGGSIVVSAAAGSGKTAVLVERVIRMLTDEKNPLQPERLLMVTFTKAAAAEMKRKIKAALRARAVGSRIAENAMLKLDRATISTMDSFCVRIVRENFESVGVSPDFRMIDENELDSLKKRAVSAVLEDYYAAEDEVFQNLSQRFLHKSSDAHLAGCIIELADFADSHPDPALWLREVAEQYETIRSPEQTSWGKYLIDNLYRALNYAAALLRRAQDIASYNELLSVAYAPALGEDLDRICDVLRKMRSARGWDELLNAASVAGVQARAKSVKGVGDLPETVQVKLLRSKVKSVISDAFDDMNVPTEQYMQDAELLRPIMLKLIECTMKYNERLLALKHEADGYYFSDILHLALDMFYDTSDGALVPTELARRVASSFDAVLIDEYQDTTRAQDALFAAISDGGKNLFVVGDVKQSIYGFRLATPKIFTDRCGEARPVEDGVFPARVILGKNFRSRAGILETVNFIFRQLMRPDAGGIDYNEDEYLYYGGRDEDKGDLCDVEVIVTESDAGSIATDAERIADYIVNTVAAGTEITVRGERRPARFSDFCVLMRSVKDRAEVIADALRERNVSVQFEANVDRFSLPEVQLFGALLSVVDNPRADDLLLTVLLFPLFGFTHDDAAALRKLSPDALFDCVNAGAEGENLTLAEKCRSFLAFLSSWRRLSVSMRPEEFVRYMLYETDFAAHITSMPGGEQRLEGLGVFLTAAQSYEKSGKIGYPGFLRYLDALRRSGIQGYVPDVRGESENAVTIMTAHKSKGLEFPFVLLADTAKKYNISELRADVLCDNDFGAAIRIVDRLELKKYTPIPLAAVKWKKREDAVTEEIRLLYVALTRAVYRLVIFGSVSDLDKKAGEAAAMLPSSGKPITYGVLKSSDWLTVLLGALMRHPDAERLRSAAQFEGETAECDAGVRFSFFVKRKAEDVPEAEEKRAASTIDRKPFSAAEYDELRRRIEYVYPHNELRGLPAKITASGFTGRETSFENLTLSQPAFLASAGVTGAARGTAYHKTLQYCDYAGVLADPDGEKRRLVERGLLSSADASLVDMKKIASFASSSVGRRAAAAEKTFRELEFRLLMPVYELYPDVTSSEKILVQGVADLVFFEPEGAVIVDYKTDAHAGSKELAERYRGQLRIYKKAVEKMFGVNVKETVLFSLNAGRTVEV